MQPFFNDVDPHRTRTKELVILRRSRIVTDNSGCGVQCLHKAIAAVKPGMRYRDVGDIISQHASSNG